MSYTWGYIKDVSLSKLDLTEDEATVQNLISRFPFYANEVITQVCSSIKPKRTFATFVINKEDIGTLKTMPTDFISFGDDVNTLQIKEYGDTILTECHDEDFWYVGYNEITFFKEGTYRISYNSRWFTFTKELDDDYELNIPTDILECIPSYIAHQCFKIDDEYKSSVFRNEYEMMLARIDNTDYKQTKTIKIGGDW